MGFPLVPKLMTLNDLERRNGHYFLVISPLLWYLEPITSQWLKSGTHCLRQKCGPRNVVFRSTWLMVIFAQITEKIWVNYRYPGNPHSTAKIRIVAILRCYDSNSW